MRNRALIFLTAVIFVSGGSLKAQTNQGKFILGELSNVEIFGSGSVTTMNLGMTTFKVKSDTGNEDNSDPDKQFSMNFIPRFGYFVLNNFAVGLDLSLTYSHSNQNSGVYIYNRTQFSAGPFIRYYIPTPKLLPFAEINYSIGSGGYKSYYNDELSGESKYQVQLYGIGIGLGVPLGEKVSFDTKVGYQSFILKAKEDNENNVREIIGTIGLKIGLTIFL